VAIEENDCLNNTFNTHY